ALQPRAPDRYGLPGRHIAIEDLSFDENILACRHACMIDEKRLDRATTFDPGKMLGAGRQRARRRTAHNAAVHDEIATHLDGGGLDRTGNDHICPHPHPHARLDIAVDAQGTVEVDVPGAQIDCLYFDDGVDDDAMWPQRGHTGDGGTQ